jgi:hypothetical protein
MKQLKMGDIMRFIKNLQKDGMVLGEIMELPIYLGDDDELNGIHTAWYTNLVDANDKTNSDNVYTVELINENRNNIKLKDRAILIS